MKYQCVLGQKRLKEEPEPQKLRCVVWGKSDGFKAQPPLIHPAQN